MSVHKNAFVPIMISENYEMKYKKLKSICVLCGTNLKIDALKPYLTTSSKMELYDRIPFFDVLKQAKDKHVASPIIVSHQYLNDLNFVHFETLFLGWPLVHNCDRLINVGYYYSSHNVSDASNLLEYARLNHSRNHALYMQKVHTFLEGYNPNNKNVIKQYSELINNLQDSVYS